jgi:hypothetical protein
VDSEYRGEASEREAMAVLPGARAVEAEAMPLRAIFLAMAKSGRAKPHAPAGDGKVGA